jgi:CMP-N,N'-diacetyllegionaminic acid synthase
MKILALITARGGSKRLPGKNIKIFAGKPLIEWSVLAGKSLGKDCSVMVSTDDQDISDVSKAAGALVPWLRPMELSTDTATSVDVVIHAMDWFEQTNGKVDLILLLQPTSPFRSVLALQSAVDKFKQHNQSVVSIGPAKNNPYHCVKLQEDGTIKPFMDTQIKSLRSQDLSEAYAYNGSFYLISPEDLRKNKSFAGKNTQGFMVESFMENIDIDTESDWEIASAVYDYYLKGKSCLLP